MWKAQEGIVVGDGYLIEPLSGGRATSSGRR